MVLAAEPILFPQCSPALLAAKHWMLILEVYPFQDQCLWLATAHDASGWDTLGYLTGSHQGGRQKMAAHILLLAQSLTWCLWAGLSAGGQGNGFLIYRAFGFWVRVARAATNEKATVAVYCTRCCSGSALVLHIRGFDVSWNSSGWSLCVCRLGCLAPLLQFAFSVAGSLFCMHLRGCSEEDKWKQRHNSNKTSCIW